MIIDLLAVALASGPCVFNDTSELAVQCTKNAECVDGTFPECKCKPGFLQTVDGDCVNVYGSPCSIDSECDQVGPLHCINGRCRCHKLLKIIKNKKSTSLWIILAFLEFSGDCADLLLRYDEKSRKCSGLVGTDYFFNWQLNDYSEVLNNSELFSN